MIDHRFRAGDDPLRGDVTVRAPIEHQDSCAGRHNHFIVHRIERQFFIFFEQRLWPLDDPDRSGIATCIAFIKEDGLRKWIRRDDLVVQFVVRNRV